MIPREILCGTHIQKLWTIIIIIFMIVGVYLNIYIAHCRNCTSHLTYLKSLHLHIILKYFLSYLWR